MVGYTRLVELGLKSVLDEAVEKAPAKIPAQQLPNYLKGSGVTSDELKFSGVQDSLPNEGIIVKKDLTEAVKNRKDNFNVITYSGDETGYSGIVPDYLSKAHPTYREDVYTFTTKGASSNLVTSGHFPDAGYIAHARRFDDLVEGKNTRVIAEMQSDTVAQQQKRDEVSKLLTQEEASKVTLQKLIYGDRRLAADLLGYDEFFDFEANAYSKTRVDELIKRVSEARKAEGDSFALRVLHRATKYAVEQPLTKNVYKKLVEYQVQQAIADGHTRVAIPISGDMLSDLKRGGNQTRYDTLFKSELEKLAKKNGWNFKEVVEEKAAHYDTMQESFDILNDFGYEDNSHALWTVMQNPSKFTDVFVTGKEARLNVHGLYSVKELLGKLKLDTKIPANVSAAINNLSAKVNEVQRGMAKTDNYVLGTMQEQQIKKDVEEVYDWYTSISSQVTQRKGKVTFAVLDTANAEGKHTPAKASTYLYSSPVAGAFAAYTALQSGQKEAEIRKQMAADGLDTMEIDQAFKDAAFIEKATAKGVPEERIKGYLEDQREIVGNKNETKNPTPVTTKGSYFNTKDFGDAGPKDPRLPTTQEQYAKEGTNAIAAQIRESNNWALQALKQDKLEMQDVLAALRIIHSTQTDPYITITSLGGNEESKRIQQEVVDNANRHTTAFLDSIGIVGAYYAEEHGGFVDAEGRPLDEGFWKNAIKDLGNSKMSIFTGMTLGAQVYKAALPRIGPWWATIPAVGGAAIGSSIGSVFDYAEQATKIGAELNGQAIVRNALTEAEWSIIGDVAAGIILKVAAKAPNAAKNFIARIKAKDVPGAKTALKQHLHITEQELDEVTADTLRLVDMPGVPKDKQKLVAAVITQPGGETIVDTAARLKPSVGSAIAKDVNTRAKDLLAKTAAIKDPDAAVKLTQDLSNYQLDVKRVFEDVKRRAVQSPKAGMFHFNMDQLAVLPIVRDIQRSVDDPALKLKLANKFKQINALSQTRTFADLLELRRTVNSLIYNRGVMNNKHYGALKGVLANIDKEITKGADAVMDKQWLSEWKAANASYSEMKQLENNVLFSAVTKPGVTPKQIAQMLHKYSTSIDSTFVEVMAKLPKQTKVSVEAEVLDIVANKYTVGAEGGFRAVDFPSMSKELAQIPFTSPEARKLQLALLKMADVFKNDVALMNVTGPIAIPKFQSYLTADPIIRAKFALASGVFKKVKELIPGEMQRNLALVNIVTEVLEEPLNKKALDQLVKEAGDRVDISAQLQQLTAAAARQAATTADQTAGKVVVYGTSNIQSLKPIANAPKGQSIPIHRIASLEDARLIARSEGINPADIKALDAALVERGYVAIQHGTDKVRRLSK